MTVRLSGIDVYLTIRTLRRHYTTKIVIGLVILTRQLRYLTCWNTGIIRLKAGLCYINNAQVQENCPEMI